MRTMPEYGDSKEVHIASQVVYVEPDLSEQISASINAMDGAEVYLQGENGKLIVVLEAAALGPISDIGDKIAALPGVINNVLVYHQSEDPDRLDDILEDETIANGLIRQGEKA